ncbi:uncharacterized protein LOC120650352 isoform X1 [Panicum virgatum]|uniref:CCHC-type domain-containing protein n=1 Tax=Panicum virgatum TaxID=38727 RepID=A0A8T0NKQ9_PANVG|nr:uncharacterized protein LOC120650352 isoform X1 [Panicum virgatum]KAG2547434.1 hypothetical protein PVAP13_9KG101640 [Panicum virgatum]
MPSNRSPNPRRVGGLYSVGSPTKTLDLSWVPDGMDRNAACILAIRIPGYEEHGTQVYHVTCDKNWVRDKDTISWMDFYADIDLEIKRGSIQSLSVSFWDKVACKYMDIDSDSSLLATIDMYWDIRKLPLVVSVINQPCHENKSATDLTIVDMKTSQLYDTEERPTNYLGYDTEERHTNYLAYDTEERAADDPWGENDETEYVGTKKRKRCKRCGQLGHMQKTCNETVYDSDAPPPAPPKSKRNKTKKKEATARPSPSTPKRKKAKKMKEVIT